MWLICCSNKHVSLFSKLKACQLAQFRASSKHFIVEFHTKLITAASVWAAQITCFCTFRPFFYVPRNLPKVDGLNDCFASKIKRNPIILVTQLNGWSRCQNLSCHGEPVQRRESLALSSGVCDYTLTSLSRYCSRIENDQKYKDNNLS